MREGGRERQREEERGSQICTITEEAQIAAKCAINVASVGGALSDYCVKLLHTSFFSVAGGQTHRQWTVKSRAELN